MRTYKKEDYTKLVVDEITCNKCEIKIDDLNGNLTRTFGNYYSSHYTGGFGSILGDMTDYEFDLCEECLKGIFQSFKIDPIDPDNEKEVKIIP